MLLVTYHILTYRANRSRPPAAAQHADRVFGPAAIRTVQERVDKVSEWKDGYGHTLCYCYWGVVLILSTAPSTGSSWAFGGVPMGTAGMPGQRQGNALMSSFSQSLGGSQPATPLDMS